MHKLKANGLIEQENNRPIGLIILGGKEIFISF